MRRNYQHAGPRPLPFARLREALVGVGFILAVSIGAVAFYCIAGAPS